GAGMPREWRACARENDERRSLELPSDERLELRARDPEVLTCLDEGRPCRVERGLRSEHVEQRGRAERVPLPLDAEVLDGSGYRLLLQRDALLRRAEGGELLD